MKFTRKELEKIEENNNIEDAINMVFTDEKLTETFFDFLNDYFDEGEDNLEGTNDYNDPEFLEGQYGVIASNYIELTDLHNIYPEASFSFPDYFDCRTVCVDGKKYDLEEIITDDDEELKQNSKELLYEIDALCADIPYNLETILKNVEKHFAERIAVEISDRNQ